MEAKCLKGPQCSMLNTVLVVKLRPIVSKTSCLLSKCVLIVLVLTLNRQISYGCFNATFQRKDNTDDADTDLIILGLYPRTTAIDSAICSLDTLSGPPTFRRTQTFLPSAACTLMSVTMAQCKTIANRKTLILKRYNI